ncbi:MAG: ExbD/TolR family protein [Planctomycetota bacterium]
MRRPRCGQRSQAGVEMASLIDMVFILLIFFIVTTSFIKESGVEIERPTSQRTVSVGGGFVPVAITRSGSVHIAGRGIAAEDSATVARVLAESGHDRVLIQADRQAPTGLLLRVMDTCRAAGASRVNVAAVAP